MLYGAVRGKERVKTRCGKLLWSGGEEKGKEVMEKRCRKETYDNYCKWREKKSTVEGKEMKIAMEDFFCGREGREGKGSDGEEL